MKIKLCGDGELSEEVQQWFTVGKSYEVLNSVHGNTEVYDVYGDNGGYQAPAIFRDSSVCAYLKDSTGNLYWLLED